MLRFSRTLAVDLAPRIRVNCIAPGVIDTSLTRGIVQRSAESVQEMALSNSMGRVGTPEKIAELALFLSSRPSFITGTTTAIDGGRNWH